MEPDALREMGLEKTAKVQAALDQSYYPTARQWLAERDELLARIEELTKQRDAAHKWRDRAEAKYDSLCAMMPWDVRYWHDKALKREDDRFRALDLARARGEQRDEYQALFAAEKQHADRWEWIARHEVCTEVVDTQGHEVPTIEEREEWELSMLMDAEKDR